MAIAALALLVALAGTGVAAVSALPRSSVGTAQLKNNAVISSKVRNHSLLRADFKPGQIPAGPAGLPDPQDRPGPQVPPVLQAQQEQPDLEPSGRSSGLMGESPRSPAASP